VYKQTFDPMVYINIKPMSNNIQITPNLLFKRSDGTWIIKHPFAEAGKAPFAIIADWCGHCRTLKTNIKTVQSKYDPKFNFFYLDGGKNDDPHTQKVLEAMGVNSFPTIFIIQKGGILTPYRGSREPFELYIFLHRYTKLCDIDNFKIIIINW
jgi:thiol-disulfide isomerase/thioredoxin